MSTLDQSDLATANQPVVAAAAQADEASSAGPSDGTNDAATAPAAAIAVVAALNGDALEHIPTASSGVDPALPYGLLPSNDALTGTGAANAR
jgi:hypothetical protein